MREYGVTLGFYKALYHLQGGSCAICSARPKPKSKHSPFNNLALDHCHRTGQVRGLLCDPCNLALGRFSDDPQKMRRAAEYLRRYG